MNKEFRKAMNQAVARGVAALDKVYGRKVWPKKIKLKRFHIASGCDCVIGQVVASRNEATSESWLHNRANEFWAELDKPENIYDAELGLNMTYSYENGAEADIGTEDHEIYAELQKIWVRWIRRRKGLKPSGK